MIITYDNNGLTSAPYSVVRLQHETVDNLNVNSLTLFRRRGSVIVNTDYASKVIHIEGLVRSDTASDLDDAVDSLKKILSVKGKSLNITYGANTRTYRATPIDVNIERDHYNITFIKYTASFLIPEGVGYALTETIDSTDNITDADYDSTLLIGGTAEPYAEFKMTFDSATAATGVELLIGGDKITITETIAASDILIINTDDNKITLNGAEVEYTGIFPRLSVGTQSYRITTTSTSHQYDLEIKYYYTYL